MGDDFRKYLSGWGVRSGGLRREQKNIIRTIAILILSMGVFFYPAPKLRFALAESGKKVLCQDKNVFWCGMNPNSTKTSIAERVSPKTEISLAEMVPEKKLGTFEYVTPGKMEEKKAVLCADKKIAKKSSQLDEKEVRSLVDGHPIAEMAPYITKRDKPVASFLLAIAKKESNWGKRSPVKAGRDCYNYWGYRGKENTTDSGYSCFDSPEHAVKVVGDRIEKLIYQKVNTPAKMVVWKCGRDCEAAGGQAAANKWISDVALYYGKLNS